MKLSFSKTLALPAEGESTLIALTLLCRGDLIQGKTQQPKKKTSPAGDPLLPASRSELNRFNSEVDGQLIKKLDSLGFTFTPGKKITVSLPIRGKKSKLQLVTFRIYCIGDSPTDRLLRVGGDLFATAKALGLKNISLSLAGSELRLPQLLLGIELGGYRFTKFKANVTKKRSTKGEAEKPFALSSITLGGTFPVAVQRSAKLRASAESAGITLVRDMVNTPPSDLPPSKILAEARAIARSSRGKVAIKVFDKKRLQKMKAGGILGVSRGSDEPPYLIHLHYRPKRNLRGAKKLVFIGKGVTFDSGGLSIKTGQGMMDMKCDMAGAACCLGTLKAIISLGDAFKHELHIVIPTVENMINGGAMKPGDVIRMINGKSVEVLNTDAEGRLILADALSYSSALKPDLMVDVATLTGAVVVALGSEYAGLFSNNAELTAKIQRSAAAAGELAWELPLAKEYRPHIDSVIADLKNITTSGGPGSIIGAIFLQEFVTGKIPWAHLDIAGVAHGSKTNEYTPVAGATGYGVRTLVELALNA